MMNKRKEKERAIFLCLIDLRRKSERLMCFEEGRREKLRCFVFAIFISLLILFLFFILNI